MILQVQDILKDAMGLIGVTEIDETPTPSEFNLALRTANVMIDRWSSQHLLLRSTSILQIVCVPGKASYTVGLVGADITANKPIEILSGYWRNATGNDNPIEIFNIQTFNNLPDKAVSTGDPLYVSYDPGSSQQSSQKGTISVYFIPVRNDTIFLEVDNYLSEFVNFTDVVSFEPAYYEALIYNLAVRLFRSFNDPKVQIPIDIMYVANNSINNLKAMNSVSIVAGMDLPGKGGKYNIFTDE